MRKLLSSLRRDDRGVSAIEYAILAAVILAAVAAFIGSADLGAIFDNATAALGDAETATKPAP